jgi:outer membrane lipoprotein LolB
MTLLRALALAAVAWLAGCAALAPDAGAPGSRAEPFDLLGRVLVSYGGRAFSSSLRWRHGAGSDEIWLMTPAAQTLAHIVDGSEGATLTGVDQVPYHAASVEALTRRALGWELPLARLQFWVRGRAAPGSVPEAPERGADGRPASLTQDGWRVAIEYFPPGEHGGLPRRIQAKSGAEEIRLVVDNWLPGPAAP